MKLFNTNMNEIKQQKIQSTKDPTSPQIFQRWTSILLGTQKKKNYNEPGCWIFLPKFFF